MEALWAGWVSHGREQYFGEIKNFFFLRTSFSSKIQNTLIHLAHPFPGFTFWVCSNKRGWPWEQFKILVVAIDQLPTPLQQKWRFSPEKNWFLATVLTIWTLFLKTVTLDWNIAHFSCFTLRDRMDMSFRLSRRRAELARWFKKKDFGPRSYKKSSFFISPTCC